MPDDADVTPGLRRPELVRVLESAARLQAVVPDAVLAGGSAAALWASHRTSFDHDHVLADLNVRFETVLEAVEATEGWVTNRVSPGKIILGELGDIESGVRQLIRSRPLEVADRYGIAHSGQVLAHIDLYCTDQRGPDAEGVATQLARQLAAPRPADQRTIRQLGSCKGLDARWTSWETVTNVCLLLAAEMTR